MKGALMIEQKDRHILIRSVKIPLFCLLAVCCALLSGCGLHVKVDTVISTPAVREDAYTPTPEPVTEEPTPEITPAPTLTPEEAKALRLKMYRAAQENSKAEVSFSLESGFYAEDHQLELTAEGASGIFYTMDGAIPSYTSFEYTRPIVLAASHADLPKCIVIRVVAYYPDGTKSPVFSNSYFLDTEIETRFTALIFSVIGDRFDLTYGPDAIFVGENAQERGSETEREIYL